MSTDDTALVIIDTEVAGDAASVRALTDAVRELDGAVSDACDRFLTVQSTRSSVWDGDSGTSFDEWILKLVNFALDSKQVVGDASEVLEAYAGELDWIHSKMADYRDKAAEEGLTVIDSTIVCPDEILPPSPECGAPGQGPSAQTQAIFADYNENVRLRELFYEIAEDVTRKRYEFQDWVTDHLVPLCTSAADLSISNQLVGAARDSAIDEVALIPSKALLAKAGSLHETAKKKAGERLARTSGNPAVRAGSVGPSAASLERRLSKSGIEATAQHLDDAGAVAAKVGKAGSTVIGLGFIGAEVATSDTPGLSLATGIGGAAGSAAAAALVAGAPIGGVVLATVIGGTLVSWGVGKLYERLPLSTRDKIDHGIKDTREAAADHVEDLWEEIFG